METLIAFFSLVYRDVDVMSAALYRSVFDEFEQFRQTYGPVDKFPTRVFFGGLENGESTEVSLHPHQTFGHTVDMGPSPYFQVELEKGKTLHIQMLAKGELNAEGQREVFLELNGQLRSHFVRDAEATKVRQPKRRYV